MKKKKIIIFLVALTLVMGTVISLYKLLHKNEAAAVITTEIALKLQSYPYYEKDPSLGFKQMMDERPDLAKAIVNDIFTKFDLFNENEKFITHERLTYRTWHNRYVVRGIYQRKLENGKILEQDVEYQYKYGGLGRVGKYFFEGKRELSKPRIVRGGEK